MILVLETFVGAYKIEFVRIFLTEARQYANLNNYNVNVDIQMTLAWENIDTLTNWLLKLTSICPCRAYEG